MSRWFCHMVNCYFVWLFRWWLVETLKTVHGYCLKVAWHAIERLLCVLSICPYQRRCSSLSIGFYSFSGYKSRFLEDLQHFFVLPILSWILKCCWDWLDEVLAVESVVVRLESRLNLGFNVFVYKSASLVTPRLFWGLSSLFFWFSVLDCVVGFSPTSPSSGSGCMVYDLSSS